MRSNVASLSFATVLGAALAAAGCGSVTAIGVDGGAGQAGASGAAGHGGTSGGVGQAGSSAGSTGAAGTGAAGQAGSSGVAGGGGHDGGAGAPDGGGSCHGLTEAQCGATPGCAAGSCASCSGGPSFSGCYRSATESPPPCPGFACPVACATLDPTSCAARADCRVDSCPGCPGTTSSSICASRSDPPLLCPAIKCAAPCANVTTLDACEARGDCHSVFVDPGTCGCAASGCCAKFSRCADGDQATCTGMPLCRVATPFCEAPFVVSYTGTCYEGCVNKKDCAP